MDHSNIDGLESERRDDGRSALSSQSALTVAVQPESTEDEGRNRVFQKLVTKDDDIIGLIAYAIYKQNKLDWLVAYAKTRERPPGDDEIAAYIIGESTPRRIATYRHMAEATLGSAMGRVPSKHAGAFSATAPNDAVTSGAPALSSLLKIIMWLLATIGLIAILISVRLLLLGK